MYSLKINNTIINHFASFSYGDEWLATLAQSVERMPFKILVSKQACGRGFNPHRWRCLQQWYNGITWATDSQDPGSIPGCCGIVDIRV